MMKISLLTLSTLFSNLESHSWLRCTDYSGTINGYDYDESQCRAWIRDWQFDNILFGLDRGVDYLPTVGSGQAICRDPINGSPLDGYSLDYSSKKAFYTSGQSVTIIHPAKNQ